MHHRGPGIERDLALRLTLGAVVKGDLGRELERLGPFWKVDAEGKIRWYYRMQLVFIFFAGLPGSRRVIRCW